jgi:L-arabinose isomerase
MKLTKLAASAFAVASISQAKGMMFTSRNKIYSVISEYGCSDMTNLLIIFIYDFDNQLYWLLSIVFLKVKSPILNMHKRYYSWKRLIPFQKYWVKQLM